MPLLSHLICQGLIMVRAACRTADQTPSRISGEHSATQNKLLDGPTWIYWHSSIRSTPIILLTCWMSTVYFARWTCRVKQHLFMCLKVNNVALHWLHLSQAWTQRNQHIHFEWIHGHWLVKYAHTLCTLEPHHVSMFDLGIYSCRGGTQSSLALTQTQLKVGFVVQILNLLPSRVTAETVWCSMKDMQGSRGLSLSKLVKEQIISSMVLEDGPCLLSYSTSYNHDIFITGLKPDNITERNCHATTICITRTEQMAF